MKGIRAPSLVWRQASLYAWIWTVVALSATACKDEGLSGKAGGQAGAGALSISPAQITLNVNDTTTFATVGGNPPILFSVISGTGTIDLNTGFYTAPALAGNALIKATDANGRNAVALVQIDGPLTILPGPVTLAINNTYVFTAVGGTGPYSFSLVSGGGSIDPGTGLYTAPGTPGSANVRVTDSLSATSDATVTINPALAISPSTQILSVNRNFNFSATGGVPPLTYSIVSGDGMVNSGTGVFSAPNTSGSTLVRVTDSLSNTSDATLTILTPIKTVSGAAHNCTLFDDGSVKCWGNNTYGQLGIGNTAHRGDAAGEMGNNLPWVSLGTGRTATDIVAGGYFNCALLDDSSIKCWGRATNGALGYGSGTAHRGDAAGEMGNSLPVVSLGTGVTAREIYAGQYHACVITTTDQVKCWGYNANGTLGLGNTVSRGDNANEMGDNLPFVSLGTGRTAKKLALGYQNTCTILDNDSLKCWGNNTYGQLGQGNTAHRGDAAGEMGDNLPAINLGTGRSAKNVTLGIYHTCAVLDDDSTKCFGRNNYGQLGYGNTTQLGDAVAEMGDNLAVVSLGTGLFATEISSSNYFTCALLNDGSMRCWGYNLYGNLGVGSTANIGDGGSEMGDFMLPTELSSAAVVLQFQAGWNHACAVLNDGEIKCWGRGNNGQLGNGSTTINLGDAVSEMGDSLSSIILTGY